MRRIVLGAALAAGGLGLAGAGCSSKEDKDPKPVDAKQDPRIQRTGDAGPGAGKDSGSK